MNERDALLRWSCAVIELIEESIIPRVTILPRTIQLIAEETS